MREFIIGSIDNQVNYHDGDIQINLTIYPSKLDGHQNLHEACVEHKPIYIVTLEEYRKLVKAKDSLEDIEW